MKNDSTRPIVLGTFKTFTDIFQPATEYDELRDIDRRIMNSTVQERLGGSTFEAIFGTGNMSHQTEMNSYINQSVYQLELDNLIQTKSRVRPTGFPAIVFDGGLIFLFLFILNYLSIIFLIFKNKLRNNYQTLLALGVPTISMLNIFITNTLEMIMWWYALSPYGLTYLILKYQNK